MQRFVRPAKFLPGQLDRIAAAEFGSVTDVVRDFRGGFDSVQNATLGFRLKGVDLVDGVLYAPQAVRHLRPRSRRSPVYSVPTEVVSGALYESWIGNRWFGNWLTDDCLTYGLATRFGSPVTTAVASRGHAPDYEALLGLHPRRVERAHFEELILFQDLSHNADKKMRADQLREQLISAAPRARHAGVFLLRGSSGMRRVLLNERSIAERLSSERGFRVLDPTTSSVDEIIGACAGARVVAGVEGSQLAHGLVAMPPDAALFVIQPSSRVVSVLKNVTDRQGQTYSFVIATGSRDRFSVDWNDVERTLDLVGAI